jgi:hypothetical protein
VTDVKQKKKMKNLKKMSLPKIPKVVRNIFRFWKPLFVILIPIASLPLALSGGTDSNGEDITKVTN